MQRQGAAQVGQLLEVRLVRQADGEHHAARLADARHVRAVGGIAGLDVEALQLDAVRLAALGDAPFDLAVEVVARLGVRAAHQQGELARGQRAHEQADAALGLA